MLDSVSDKVDEIEPIELMLLDFQMPRKNGIQVIESVRKLIR